MECLYYRAIWISDVHLGTREAKSDWLLNFLSSVESEYLYLVGDIFDMWKMKQGQWFWNESSSQIIECILDKSRNGTKVIYVPGNHDYGIRKYENWCFGDIQIVRQTVHRCSNGRRMLVTHGDEFDAIIMSNNLTTRFGNKAYDVLLRANCWFNELRERFGLGYWSLSTYIKVHIKQANEYIKRYEDTVISAALSRNVDGVICGHIHHPNVRSDRSIQYINTGDWVEHCTAVCEHADGELKLFNWPEYTRLVSRGVSTKALSDNLPKVA